MGEKKGKKGEKKGGGFGKLVMLFVVVVGVGGAAFYFVAPDQFQAQLDRVMSLIGG